MITVPDINRRHLLQTGMLTLGGSTAFALGWRAANVWAADTSVPSDVTDPVEVSGEEAVAVIGRLPGARRMYVVSNGQGESYSLGSFLVTRKARPIETGNTYELMTFAGPSGSAMPRHLHRSSHVGFLVVGGDVELELDGRRWRMLRGDFANIPSGTPHGWSMRSDRAQVALFIIGDRAGAAFAAMGSTLSGTATPANGPMPITTENLAKAAMAGDFQIVPGNVASGDVTRVANLTLPSTPTPYLLLDGGGERYGGNTFYAKNANTNGQFLFIITEGGTGPGIPAHFHARHTEDFFALDGETMVWAYGKAVSLKTGDFVQAPPRNLHGFKMIQPYNRFVGFLTPGIFENFFTRGQPGHNGVGGRGAGEGAKSSPEPFALPPRGDSPAGSDRNAIFRQIMMSGAGPDGWPLDVHGPTLPLPAQDPLWIQEAQRADATQQILMLEHANLLCGGGNLTRRALTPELQRALALKPRAENFI